jgi:RNA ligase (TIGR02306 family)
LLKFWSGSSFYKAAEQYKLAEILKDGEVLYFEIYGSGIQKNYSYGCKEGEIKIVAFDVMVFNEDGTNRYLDSEEFKKFCDDRNIPRVPELYNGPYNFELIKKLTVGNSVMCPSQKVIEGVVIKPIKEEIGTMGRKKLKLISETYLDDKTNTDYH